MTIVILVSLFLLEILMRGYYDLNVLAKASSVDTSILPSSRFKGGVVQYVLSFGEQVIYFLLVCLCLLVLSCGFPAVNGLSYKINESMNKSWIKPRNIAFEDIASTSDCSEEAVMRV